jgi:protein TonB
MTFRRSLYLSIAAHLLIFSTAIAVAQYAGGTFVSYPHAVQVSLVSLSPGPREGAVTVSKQDIRSQTNAPQPVDPMPGLEQASPRQFPADPGTPSEVPDDAHTAAPDTAGNDVGPEGQGQAIAYAGNGQADNARRGFIAPQQWTAIQAAIERTKNYPRLARERGIEGVVNLRFRLNSEGSVETVEVVKSSGYEILDTASVRAVYRAAPMPSVDGWIEVPIAYVLNK